MTPACAFPRLHGLDALRGLTLLLGVVLHAAMTFMPGADAFWIVADTSSSTVMNLVFFSIHVFRMTVFFLLAGFFGRLLCERMGTVAFARDRWRRIVVPLLVAWPFSFAGIVVAVIWAATITQGSQTPVTPSPGPDFTPESFPLTHLWFLYVLALFYVATLALRALASRLDPRDRIVMRADAWLKAILGPWAAPVLALPLAVALFAYPDWYAWFGIPTPDSSLYPNPAAVVGFGLAFAAGWLLHRQRDLLDRIQRQCVAHLALAVMASAACLALAGLSPTLSPAPKDASTAVYAWTYATASWAWTLALIGMALRHASGDSPARRWLADSSYWVYLAHLPVVMLLQVVARQFEAPWWIEFPVLVASALVLLLASYQYGVRYTAIGARLNGRRRQRAVVQPAPSGGV